MWGVWCTVSGGVTGFRASWLKSDGTTQGGPDLERAPNLVLFESEVQAAEEARDLNKKLGSFHSHTGATFHYTAREFA